MDHGGVDTNPKIDLDIPSVLVVDDDPERRVTSGNTLEANGINVLRAASAHEARHYLADQSAFIEVIVCTDVMPDESGLDLLTQLRQSPGLQPQFLLLSDGRIEDTRRELADGFLPPTVAAADLLAAVRDALHLARVS